MDTGGDLLEYINCFVNKKLFNIADKVKFLFPITFDSLKEERGGQIIRQVKILQTVCQESLADMINSVLPILTKCKQVDAAEEDETDKVDPEAVKGTIY